MPKCHLFIDAIRYNNEQVNDKDNSDDDDEGYYDENGNDEDE